MKGKHRKEVLAIAEAICNAMPRSPGCCMTEDRKIRCTVKNCRVYPVALKVWEALEQFWHLTAETGSEQ